MNTTEIANTFHKVAVQPAVSNAYVKAESLMNNTREVSFDPAVKSFTYKAKNGFGFSLDWEHKTVSANWADVVLSFCWESKKFEMSRLGF